jgi:RNA polymerase sigma factor (sigma-70 family)
MGDDAAAVAAGDAQAFGELFDRHAADVHAFCARRTSEPDAADDLLSMVFLEAWRCRDRAVLVEDSLRPWLFGIARNVVRHSGRSAFRYRAALNRYAAAEVAPAADLEDTVARSVDGAGLEREVALALAALPRRDRDVAELCLLHGMTTAAAAAALGIPEGTVKSRLSRTRGRLRRLLQTGESVNPPGTTGNVQVEWPTVAPAGGLPR